MRLFDNTDLGFRGFEIPSKAETMYRWATQTHSIQQVADTHGSVKTNGT
jgi:hypothetical protein